WREHAIWWLAEALYFFAIWMNLVGDFQAERGLPDDLSVIFIVLRYLALLWLCLLVVRDIRRPAAHVPLTDDPLAGPLRGLPDALRLYWAGRRGAPTGADLDPVV
ncbi:MAG: glycosyltransferase family 87 protein, partial [Angustibacter sp.]